MKKTLSFIVLLAVTLLAHAEKSPNGQDYTLKSGAMYFADNKDGSLELVDADAFEVENMVIPDEVDGKLVTSIRNNSFKERIDIYSVEIGANIISIGASSFESAEYIEKVDFSKAVNLKSIGNLAFSKTAIKDLTIMSECQINNAFFMCTSLKEVKLLKPVTKTFATFQACSLLNKIEMSDEQAEIGRYFLEGTAIESVTIPKNVQVISEQAFKACNNLSTLIFADGCKLTRIEQHAFENCPLLTYIKLPETVTYISTSAFYSYNIEYTEREIWLPAALQKIDGQIQGKFSCVHIPNMELCWTFLNSIQYAENGMDIYVDGILLEELVVPVNSDLICPGIKSLRKITMGDNVKPTTIKADNCKNLETVIIGRGQTTIEGFRGCSSLIEVSISEKNNLTIGAWAFHNCTSLETIVLPNITTIGDGAFLSCTSLKNVELPSLVTMGNSTFKDCTSLKNIELPSLESIPSRAFQGCSSLETAVFPNVVTFDNQWGQSSGDAFYDCIALKSVNMDKLSEVPSHCFSDCIALKEVSFAQATCIREYAFDGCKSLNVFVAPCVTTIKECAFRKCSALETFETQLVEAIESNVFNECLSLKSFKSHSVKTIGYEAFSGCTSLENFEAPYASSIGYGAFRNCTSLKTFDFSSVKTIDGSAFVNCSGLTDIDISHVESIKGEACFEGCIGLLHVKLGNTYVNLGHSEKLEMIEFMTDVDDCTSNFRLNGNPATVVFHGDVKHINGTFKRCPSLYRIEFNGKTGKFSADAFSQCTNLKEVLITDLDSWVNGECDENSGFIAAENVNFYLNGELLKDVVLKDILKVRTDAFYNSTIETVVIEPSENGCIIESKAFYHCKNLKHAVIGEGVTSIGKYAFDGCTSVTELKLPTSVTSIDLAAFQKMGALKHITLSPNLKDIPSGLLYNTGALETLIIPEGVETVGYTVVAYNCNNLRFISLPSTLKTLTDAVNWGGRPASFSDLHKDVVFYSWSPTPPSAPNENFTGLDVHVPIGCKDAYMAIPVWSKANIIDDLQNGHNVTTDLNSITIRVPRNTSEGDLQIDRYKVYVYKTDIDGNEITVGTYEYDSNGTPITRSADDEQILVVEGLEPNTKYTYKFEGYTKSDDLVIATSKEVKTLDSTGIGYTCTDKNSDGDIYNIQGIKVNVPGKSVYIKNGKKYINR